MSETIAPLLAAKKAVIVSPPSPSPKEHQIGTAALAALIFFSVSGGPFGMEEAVQSAGPLVTIVGLLVLPMLWSVPEALITAECAPAFAEPSGSVAWVESAFGPFWGWMKGYLSWLSGVTDNALYPVLIADYLTSFFHKEAETIGVVDGLHRVLLLLGLTLVLTYLNWRGLDVVGTAAIVLMTLCMLPFVIMCIAALVQYNKLDGSRLGELPEGGWGAVQWSSLLNILFWQLNYWDSVATFAGDVKNPGKAFPRALAIAVALVVLSTLVPLATAVTGTRFAYTEYTDGFFGKVGSDLVGKWLGAMIALAAALSSVGMFEAEMASDAFSLMGLAERGHLPAFFAHRSRHGTPSAAIVCSACGITFLASMSFLEIVQVLNFLYMLAMLIEFAAFVRLRVVLPCLPRPYRIPLGTWGICAMLSGPVILLVCMLAMAPLKTWLICGVAVLMGCGLYYVLHHPCTRRRCVFLQDPFERRRDASTSSVLRVYGTDDLGYVLEVTDDEANGDEEKMEAVVPV
ncbi:hypothetical protein NSK_007692 [Nannochloropsis salina CCMP1776]|uniref:Amino acid permease/ SLC12A domain-containing protein n=1 Tax=Nannochloropsis salina CCMP1776 TaxID=1027361 RepID=A0A4D9CWQ4_9STRA|nr:hypothetical protein NSK_007692 [Nannochloropsis salina CCMP1776]|eukprot:TFJ81049.1 hypothetical protein NSK_007692 [Nannochloropsis salina CCMP1776]